MDDTGHTLPRRVTAVLHAKQHLVFFAIALYTLDFAVPLFSAWLYRHAPIADLLEHTWGPLADAVARRSVAITGLFVVYLLVSTWLRAGYIRSLVGRFHFGPRDSRQFLRLLGLELILGVVGAAATAGVVWSGDSVPAMQAVLLGLMLVYFVVLYADYIIVLADVGTLRAIALSWRTVLVTFVPSALILLVVTLLGDAGGALFVESVTGDLAHAAPMLLVDCVVLGGVVFVADVSLIVLYLDAVERGKVRS
jgi:hypothetical protein